MTRYGSLVGMTAVFLCSASLLSFELHRCLVVNNPEPSDVILVPSGDFTLRTSEALTLYSRGYAAHIVIDEGADTLTFGRTLAERRREQLAQFGENITICPIRGETTREEAREARLCLQASHPRRVLIVTSDFHTRRSLQLFQQQMPGTRFTVSSVDTEFSRRSWWHPESLAICLGEWMAIVVSTHS